MLPMLDRDLRTALTRETQRKYTWLTSYQIHPDAMRFHTSEQPQGLPLWLAYGKKVKADFLLVPQVLDWREREGSNAGVTRAAHVRVEFFLLNIHSGTVVGRSIYDEEQTGLVNNLLSVGSFLSRGGVWVKAERLAAEGMKKAIKDLGL
jgi:hypothetical protein